jgi:hypothetical protein
MKITATTFTAKYRHVSPLRTLSRKRNKIRKGVKNLMRGKGGVIKGSKQSMGAPGGFRNARTGAFR